jgi:hypothetical protein
MALSADQQEGLEPFDLVGAEAIGLALYGKPGQARKIYHLMERAKGPKPPIIRLGGQVLYARSSSIRRWTEEQERRTSEGE